MSYCTVAEWIRTVQDRRQCNKEEMLKALTSGTTSFRTDMRRDADAEEGTS